MVVLRESQSNSARNANQEVTIPAASSLGLNSAVNSAILEIEISRMLTIRATRCLPVHCPMSSAGPPDIPLARFALETCGKDGLNIKKGGIVIRFSAPSRKF